MKIFLVLVALGCSSFASAQTFIRPDGHGGWTIQQPGPGNPYSFVRPSPGGGYSVITPGQLPTFVQPTPGGGWTVLPPNPTYPAFQFPVYDQ